MKLQSLTEEQKARLDVIKDEYIIKYLTYKPINKVAARKVVRFVYNLIKKPMPKIHYTISPRSGQILANKLSKTKNVFYDFGTFLTVGWASFYAFYDTFVEFGILTEKEFPKYFKLRETVDTNIFLDIEFDTDIILIERPVEIHRDGTVMHCVTGPAIKWKDGYGQYYIHGRPMPEWIFKKFNNKTLTKEDFLNETNEDVRAGIYEVVEGSGEGSMMKFLDAKEVDKQTIVHKNGSTEECILYKSENSFPGETDLTGKSNVPLAWVKLTCPTSGTRYLIPSDSSFTNVLDALKYHRPEGVPESLKYVWHSRN